MLETLLVTIQETLRVNTLVTSLVITQENLQANTLVIILGTS